MTSYRACTDRDLPQLKHIWLSCFEEREDAAELFFQRNHSTYHAYACEVDGRLVSALYLIDCSLSGDRAHYLCGAATLPEFRGRGFMSALIRYALDDAKRRGDRYSVLMPANDTLYDYYARFGYQPSCAMKYAVFDTDTDRKSVVGSPELRELQANCSEKYTLLWEEDYIRFAAEYYGCYGAETAQNENTFALYMPDGECAEVYYAVYSDIEALKALLGDKGIRRFRLTGSADDPRLEGEITKPFGMILPLCGDPAPENVYIGITLQ